MKTFTAKEHEVQRSWHLIDAKDKVLGRLASEVASRLRGKHKPEFTPHVDTGDYIVIINAKEIKVTGKKRDDKMYYRHTGYVGNLKSANFRTMIEKKPEMVIQLAVKGMLPKGPLGRKMIKKMKVYADSQHEHQAQQPQLLEI
jgi:large subunit ribosomal protein L13